MITNRTTKTLMVDLCMLAEEPEVEEEVPTITQLISTEITTEMLDLIKAGVVEEVTEVIEVA